MRCEEIMKRELACVFPEDTVQTAASLLRARKVGFLPVCNGELGVLGTLTDRDIAIRVVAEGKSATTLVEEVMSNDCVSCRPEDDLQIAERLMADHQVSRIMCTDGDERLVGVISLSDIAQHEMSGRASETLRQVSSREASIEQAEPGI